VESRLGNLIDDLCGTAFLFCVGNSKKSIGTLDRRLLKLLPRSST
jgi:hypothetical protein